MQARTVGMESEVQNYPTFWLELKPLRNHEYNRASDHKVAHRFQAYLALKQT